MANFLLTPLLFLMLIALLLAQTGCGSKTALRVPAPAHGEAAPDWVQECSVFQDEWYCGYGASKEEAMDRMVNQISVKIESEYSREMKKTMTQRAAKDVEKSETIIQRDNQRIKISSGSIEMTDVRLYTSQNGTAYAAVKKTDVAKGFAEQLRPKAESLEFAANAAINEKHPKLKSEAWQKTQAIWNEFAPLLIKTESLDKERAAPFKPMSELYARAREEYLGYCKTAKLYWKEQNDVYSNVAFSKLSKNLKMEKKKTFEGKTCEGHGLLLVYKNTEHECKYAGMFKCSHKPSMVISSCWDDEYRSLESPKVEAFQNVEEVALKRLHEKLEYESFWSEWEQEIKQWRPICE
jgi:predicted small lipoprotein YifL